jgi:hypothetical protein
MVVGVRASPGIADIRHGEMVYTLDLSSSGARLGGLKKPVEPGTILHLQRKHNRATCRVIWNRVLAPGEVQLGIDFIEADPHFWGLDIGQTSGQAAGSELEFKAVLNKGKK